MSSTWNNNIGFTVFGESHGPAIGVVMDNVPPGRASTLTRYINLWQEERLNRIRPLHREKKRICRR